jgi:hypothetical protein
MHRPHAPRRLAQLLAVISVLGFTVVTVPTHSYADDPDEDIVACDADDPDFGTNCEEAEDEEGEGEVRDGYLDSRQVPGDVITTGDLELAAQQADAIPREVNGLVNPDWNFAGPSNVGGRVTDIAPDPTQAGTVFVGVATAGVWKPRPGLTTSRSPSVRSRSPRTATSGSAPERSIPVAAA